MVRILVLNSSARHLFAGLLAVLLIACEQPAGDSAPSTGEELIPPTLATITPTSPSNQLTITVTGTGRALTNAVIYSDSLCTQLVSSGQVDASGNFAFIAGVTPDTIYDFYARSVDGAGAKTACTNTGVRWIQDSTPPIAPISMNVTGGTPQNNNSPVVTGSTEALATVSVFTNSTCTSAVVGTGTVAMNGTFTITATAADDTTVTFYAQAVDVAGNISPCSTSNFVYTEDSTPPVTPASLGISPASPSSNNSPTFLGTAEASTTVRVYTNASCTSAVLASGTANGAGNFSIVSTVGSDTVNNLYATARDAAGNVSPCSSGVTYIEDSTPPVGPISLTVTGGLRQNNNTPHVTGIAEALADLNLYTNSACTSALAGNTSVTGAGTWDIQVNVSDDTATTYYARATDLALNVGPCSTAFVVFVEDSTPPVVPTALSVAGGTPQNNNSPSVTGSTEANASVNVYTDSGCTSLAGSGSADGSGNFSVPSTAPNDAVTTFYAKATDVAGNSSACSTSNFVYTEDSTPPTVPAGLAINPVGPANNNIPQYSGNTEVSAFVQVYTNSSCTSAVHTSGSADGSGNFTIVLAPTDDTTTTFYSTARDGVGNTSACSSGLTYVEDSTPPALPSGLATVPTSPANNNSPDVTGNAESGATVNVYTNSSCTSAVAGSVVASGGSFTIGVTVTGDAVTSFWAKTTDPSGNASGCSTSTVAYTEDSTPPALPTSLATSPVSPANNNLPNVTGNAESGASVYIYTNSSCTSALAGSATASGGAFTASVNPNNDTTTTYYAKAIDVALNDSGCSTSSVTYVEDSTPPATPSGLASVPAPPANNNTPHVTGSTEANAIVRIYTNPTCTSAIAQSGSADGSGIFDLILSVSDDTTTSFYAKSLDAVGNTSGCSSGAVYIEDSTGIPPASLASTPTGPANSNSPDISGTAEIGSTVSIYTNSSCTSAVAGSGIASAGTFSITVSVLDDTTTTFWAKLVDIAGNTSPCSTSNVTFTEDSTPPATPSVAGTTNPASPNNDSTPDVSGTTEANATVELFTDSSCSSAVIGTGTANGSGNWTISATVSANATTTIWATATDAASNESACSVSSVTYVHDNIAPATPTGLASDPISPVDDNSFDLTGSTEAGVTVRLYTNSGCSSAVLATGTADGSGNFTFPLTVSDDTTTTIYARATDAASNDSACSSVFVNYIEDSSTPKPSGFASTPTSPSQTTAANLTGSAETNAIVRLYTNNDCTSAVIGTNTATAGAFSIGVTVSDNSSVTYWAEATDALGHISGCSTESFTYTHDNSPPAMPVISGTNPTSPSFANTFNVTGTSEAASTIKLYTNSSCTSAIQGTSTTDGAGNFATSATVSSNSSTTFWATATDGAGNTGACSSTNVTYDEDSVVPATPTLSGTTPASPSNSNVMAVTGTAEALATIRLYTNSSCTSAVQGTGSVTAGGTFSVSATVSSDSSTTFWATTTDAAGNISTCSSTNLTYLEDSTPPVTPTITGITPNEPADTHVPVIAGTGTTNEPIKLYSDSGCTNLVFTGAIDGSGNFSLAPTVLDDTTNTYYAKSIDAVGNESGCTSSSVSYTNYSVAEGVAYLTGTRVVASTDIHQGAASPFQWSYSRYHSTFYSHSTTSNSHRLQVKVTGDYLIHLTAQIQTDSSTSNQIIFQIRFGDGTTQAQSSRGACYASMGAVAGTQATKQSTCNGTARLSLTANQIIDVTARGSRGTGPTYSSGSAILVEYLPSTRDTYYGSALQNTNNQTNLSLDSNQYYLKWTDLQKDAIYTHSDSTSPEIIQFAQAGAYFVSVDVPMTSSTNYNNHRFKIYGGAAGSTIIPGAEFKQGYSGASTTGFSSSAHWAGILHNVEANDLLRVSHQREGNTVGTQQINSARPAGVYIEKLNASGIYMGRGSTVTGANSTNYNQDSSYLHFTTDTLIDTGAYTHSTSTDPHQITLKDPGLYKVTFSTSLTTTTADASPRFNLQIDGVNYENAVTASTNIENVSDHSESSAALVYYVQTTSANKVLSVVSTIQHSVAAIVSAALSPDNDHTITVRKMTKSSSP